MSDRLQGIMAQRPDLSHLEQSPPGLPSSRLASLVLAGAGLAAVFVWAYWPTILSLVAAWRHQADYSHGYLVVPLALFFLWARRDRFPGMAARLAWLGLVLVGLSVALRAAAALVYLDAGDAWSILPWVAGAVWFLFGFRVLMWSLPSILFLVFMIPLPFRMERWLSLPLQAVATKLSCWGLQTLGQPALAEGHTILINDLQLEVEQACSGLRIFVGIVALAFACVILSRRAWWVKLILLASAVPIALLANAARIVATGLIGQWVSSQAAERFTHDASGWVMIPFAAALFAATLWYVSRLVEEVEPVGVGELMRAGESRRR